MFPFNIRVYGILLNELKQVLLSDEYRNGRAFTKFPGGGLEFGEGFKEALKREFIEELNLDVEVGELFYFNDFYQISAFNPEHQVHSFYYLVHSDDWRTIKHDKKCTPLTKEGEKQRWVDLKELSPKSVSFPIDQLVVSKLGSLL
jgi:8-oxo-dGTP diphosphatase